MAQFTIAPYTLPGSVTPAQMLDALCKEWGYQAQVLDPQTAQLIPNPQTKVDFAHAYLGKQFKAIYLKQAQNAAAQAAVATVVDPGDLT